MNKQDEYYASRIENFVDEALKCGVPFYKAKYENINGEKSSLLVNLKGTDNCLNEMIISELLKPDKFDALFGFVFSDNKKYNKERSGYFDSKNDAFTEKRLAICLYNYGCGTILGTPVHYEMPIYEENIGAIDLVYKTDKYINLVELKSGNSPERLLRAILELATYYKNLNIEKFKEEFAFSDNLSFQFVILLEEGTQAFKDAEYLKNGKLPNLKKLLKRISNECGNVPIKIYSIDKLPDNFDICMETKKILKDVDFEKIIKDMEIEYEN